MTWQWHLGDDELLARLTQRGVHPDIARELVDTRDDPESAAIIAEVLGG